MELPKQPPPQEILPRQTSQTYAAFRSVIFLVRPVFGRVALEFSCPFRLSSSSCRESGTASPREPVASFCLFPLSSVPGRESDPERWQESSERSPWPFLFRPMLSLFQLTSFPVGPPLFPFQLTRPRVRPAPLSVEQVVVRLLSLVFGRSKSLQER